jgi:hypothetical protein
MGRTTFKSLVYGLMRLLQLVSSIGAGAVGVALKVGPNYLSPPFSEYLEWVCVNAGSLVIGFGLAGVLGKSLCWWVGPPWVWEVVEKSLDKFREQAFRLQTGDADNDHRVTLFRYIGWYWLWPWQWLRWRAWYWPWGWGCFPWSGWLVPVARSSSTHRYTGTFFLAPRNPNDAEGVAVG